MRIGLLGAAAAIVATIVGASLWLKSPPGDLVPAEFRGTWLNKGAECNDTDAQARITGSTVNYDVVAFKAVDLTERRDDFVSLTGEDFARAEGVQGKIQLQLRDRRTELVIVSPDLPKQVVLVRCSGSGGR